ncbi:biotin--[acetyl-CoA-carboxylase] ligase [Urechidicola vernalis]|uniref:Biotin--[acetyl-CoA-carboxylase] ligase n=1 Tax=Urechidicola vernalis TaxID=3075600 RepID=A0ABU2Y3M4_9FLAO|nr:biotin--[acetyl-CoA-carboxylase] ligase [Urechidicola sp. P050]MDT0552416.1 biotin--[acetyl-CoA-carboxylase] ligase [Urechidicola sp. P050]
MHLIKLNATESTNTFLKEYIRKNDAENYTVVCAKEQTKGRGQYNASWFSEGGKNLTFSVLLKFDSLFVKDQFYISKIISLAVKQVLVKFLPNKITVKWPNDILADDKKIAGILIENGLKNGIVSHSIVGIGLNVNQEQFPKQINAISMKNLSCSHWDLDVVLAAIVDSIKSHMYFLENRKLTEIDAEYLNELYRFDQISNYADLNGNLIKGKIIGVSRIGKLQLELESKEREEFEIKELKFI